MVKAYEVNFDGLVGPTHNYSGLSLGNVASTSHKALESNPQEAVLQGLAKMKALSDLGFKQGVIPPQERPAIYILRKLGFDGSDKSILERVSLELLQAVTSASSMWTANAATVSPLADTKDHRTHFTPANLVSKFHRSIEPETTSAVLKKIFKDKRHFTHHECLPPSPALGDEGAANHTRLCTEYGERGVEFFVYGRHGITEGGPLPRRFPARQTFEASSSIARVHKLDETTTVFAQQNPEAIDAGVFHNDVAGVGNKNFYFYHEKAYLNSASVIEELRKKFTAVTKDELATVEVPVSEVSMEEVVKSYLFNSQLLTTKDNGMILVAPTECLEIPRVKTYLESLLNSGRSPIKEIKYFDLRQSMRNGGGPACLRLRVVLTEKELKATNQKVLMNEKLHANLVAWAKKHYRDRLTPDDLADYGLLRESRTALDKLTQILGLGSIYPFQRN